MADFDAIWKFVDRTLKTTIPAYIKNVFKFCGYDNCYTISSIENCDLEYIQTEVRQGGLKKFCEENKGIALNNVLEGSTRTFEDFEFSRGHIILIKSIVTLVKENLSENGIDGFSETFKAKPKKADTLANTVKNMTDQPLKMQKYSSDESMMESNLRKSDPSNVLKNKTEPNEDVIKYHQKVLVKKAIISLCNETPKLYEKHSARIRTAATTTLVSVIKIKNQAKLKGKIRCPFCKYPFAVFHILSGSNSRGSWNVHNFARHLKDVHVLKKRNKWVQRNLDEDLDENFYENILDRTDIESSDDEKPGDKSVDDKNSDYQNHDDRNLNEGKHNDEKPDEILDDGKLNKDLYVGSVVNMKDVLKITSNKIILTPVANNDNEKSENDQQNEYFFVEVPGKSAENIERQQLKTECKVDKDGKKSMHDTFIVYSNEKIENIEDISMDFPDSLNESYLLSDDAEEKNANNINECNSEQYTDNLLDSIESIPVFRNGYRNLNCKPTISTFNTCAFDSVFSIYASIYFDNPNYRKFTDLFISRSAFSDLLKNFFETFNSKRKLKSPSESWEALYDYRSRILNEIFSNSIYYKNCDNVMRNSKAIFINCETGIGGLFGQICFGMTENIASSIEIKICYKCQTTKGKIQPFISIDADDVDIRNIQKSISLDCSLDKLCKDCKGKCTIEKVYNNLLVLEVEPNINVKSQTMVSIQQLPETITVGKTYQLYAVIQHKPTIKHFVPHVKRKGCVWKTYDDLKPLETDSDITQDILPYMLFYVNNAGRNTFEKTLLSFYQNNKLCIPMVRKILSSERLTQHDKPSAQKSSTGSTSASEWKKKREQGWKY